MIAHRMKLLIGFLAIAAAAPAAPPDAAEVYPNKPVRLVVPFGAGGTGDILARVIGQHLSTGLGQQVVIDNRPGAGGNIGADVVAKAAPDGYTLLLAANSTHGANVSLYKKMPFDPVKDFAPVTLLASVSNLLLVHPSVPANSIKELIALAKSKPGQLNFASSGNGTSTHLAGELFKSMAGVDIVHIPYKSGAPAVTDLLSGHVTMLFNSTLAVLPHVKAGKLKALGISSVHRSPVLPEMPTIAESGLPGFEVTAWFGILAPAGTPKEIIHRLHAEIVKVLRLPEVKARLSDQGAEPVGNTPERFAAYIQAEIAKWAEVVKVSGARLD